MEHIEKIIKLQDINILAIAVFSITISIIDIKTYRIPDILLLLLLIALLLNDFITGYHSIVSHLLSAVIVFALFFAIFYFARGMGFGDVKYAAVLAYGLGLKGIYIAIAVAVISGLLFFLVRALFLGWNKKRKLAFAPFLSLGAIASIIIGRLWTTGWLYSL